MNKRFEIEFFSILEKDITFGGIVGSKKFSLINISGEWGLNRGTTISYNSMKIEIRWPITVSFHIDIVRYPKGTRVSKHVDLYPQQKGSEYRFVVILQKAKRGGQLLGEKFILNFGRMKLFSTRTYHEVTKVEEGTRIALLVGVFQGPRIPLRKEILINR